MSGEILGIAAAAGLVGLIVGFTAAALATSDDRRRLRASLRHVYWTLATDQTRLRWTTLLDEIRESLDD